MSAIYPTITIEWASEEYEIKPDFGVITKIEQKVNLAALRTKTIIDGIPCLSSLAIIYGCLLRSAGVSVKDDDIYASMYGANDDSGMDQEGIITACAEVINSLVPRASTPKKKTRKAKA